MVATCQVTDIKKDELRLCRVNNADFLYLTFRCYLQFNTIVVGFVLIAKGVHVDFATIADRPPVRSSLKNGVFWDVTPCGCCKN
jgi:hypothetical protein